MPAKGRGKAQKDSKSKCPGKGWAANSPGAILASTSGAHRGQKMQPSPAVSSSDIASPPELEAPSSPTLLEAAPDSIIKPILAAIEGFKTMLMVCIEHLASECTLIRHDLDKIRGRLKEAEAWISTVEDQQGSQASQIADLQLLVSSLVNKVDDVENRQRRNNSRVVGLPEGDFNAILGAAPDSSRLQLP